MTTRANLVLTCQWRRIAAVVAAALGSHPQAFANTQNNEYSRFEFDDNPYLLDNGLSITPVFLEKPLVAGFEVSIDTGYVRDMRFDVDERFSVRSGSAQDLVRSDRQQTTRWTDAKVDVRRSIALTKKNTLFIDLLGRARLPSGSTKFQLGSARREVMLDAGVRAELKGFSLWAGGAKRFNDKTRMRIDNRTYWRTGRDINEFYAGIIRPLSRKAEVRMDFLTTQSDYKGYKRDWSLSGEYSIRPRDDRRIAVYASHDRGAWGKENRIGVSVSWTLGRKPT